MALPPEPVRILLRSRAGERTMNIYDALADDFNTPAARAVLYLSHSSPAW